MGRKTTIRIPDEMRKDANIVAGKISQITGEPVSFNTLVNLALKEYIKVATGRGSNRPFKPSL